MNPMTLQESQIAVAIPGLPDTLLLRSVKGTEKIGRLFEYQLEILCTNHGIKHLDVLGQSATISLYVPNSAPRFINGHVAEFTYAGTYSFRGAQGTQETFARYVAMIRPWLWFLTRRSDGRIYQGKTVPDIIEETFDRHGFADVVSRLTSQYEPWEYCAQYNETDFDFVMRLMEHEGIYYYYEHEDGKHTVVLCDGDGIASHRPAAPGYETIAYHIYDPTVERVYQWSVSQQVHPSAVGLKDFNFKGPRNNLATTVVAHPEFVSGHVPSQADLEVFDYPGKYESTASGDAYARMRMEELEAQYEAGTGRTNARMIAVGGVFDLAGHPRAEENRGYMVLSATFDLHWSVVDVTGSPPPVFQCDFQAMDSTKRYRLPRITPRPIVQGPQTAIVVGPSGETVWPDEYGRVKVQFHWDRYGQSDESSSCWIRVSQAWAGAGWGGMHIPHIGQEVVVEFLEGDPDRPLITGRVYNAANMPAMGLPNNKHKSILRDDYGNELIFDATPGDEQIVLQTPHHNSRFVLGSSAVTSKTGTDNGSVSMGDSFEVKFGTSTSTSLGSSSEATVGVSSSYAVSSSLSGTIGFAVEWGLGLNYSVSEKDDISKAESDWMQVIAGDGILDCKTANGQQLFIVAGEKRESIAELDSDGIELTAGPGKLRTGEFGADAVDWVVRSAMIAGAALHTAHAIRTGLIYSQEVGDADAAVQEANQARLDAEAKDWATGVHSAQGVIQAVVLAAVLSLYRKSLAPDKVIADIQTVKYGTAGRPPAGAARPLSPAIASRMKLDKTGLIEFQTKQDFNVEVTQDFNVEAGRSIDLEAKGPGVVGAAPAAAGAPPAAGTLRAKAKVIEMEASTGAITIEAKAGAMTLKAGGAITVNKNLVVSP